MSFDSSELEMTYENSESMDATGVRLAQWARAEALKAVLASGQKLGMRQVELQVQAYAQMIVEGSLPTPRPGTYY